MKKVSVCICGSIFLEELMKYKTDYFVQETKAINCSPISKNICTYNTQSCMSENYTWEKFMNNSLAEWLVIEMKCIADILVPDMDIWNKIEQLVFCGGLENEPCFRFSEERYIKYYYNYK